MSSNALKITLVYIVIGSLWILLSDLILLHLVGTETLSQWQTIKGWFYIIATGIVLYFMIKNSEKSLLKTSNELLTNEKKFREAVDHINALFIIYDANRRIQYMNKTASLLSGKKTDAFLDKKDEEIFPDEITQVYLPLLLSAFELKKIQTGEREFLFRDKSFYSIIENIPVLDDNNNIQFMIAIWHDVTERKLFVKKLLKSRSELKELTKHLNIARENERASIARDIHDHLGQMLTGMKMDLSMLKKKINENQSPFEKFNQLEAEIDETIKITRRISEDLRPPVMDDLGLLAAVESHVEVFQNRTGIRCIITSNIHDLKLNNELSITLFRIIQEALTNVARHSNANEVNILMNLTDSNLNLEIKDNGIGFNINEIQNKTFGLLGMRERMSLINAEFSIDSIVNEGTKISATIPINQRSISND
jgi:PAS domain S-box-containing protein